jgi:pimeloyl-ACP methyl ester carboxylesterase
VKPTRFLRRLPVAVAALALITPTTTAVAAPKSVVPRIVWGSCGADLPAFQCATVEVPTDYDRPHGPTTTIALTRLPATDPARRIGTLFTNPGGPGGSGVDFVQQSGLTAYQPEVRARFDILGFDPRGVGKSDPVTCFPTAAEEAAAFAGQPAYPVTAEEEREYTKLSLKLAISCRTTSPDRLAHYSTANVARDMNLLRQAVGDDKLSYVGYSYGTYLGATYARLFPNKIRAFVLDGTLSPEWYSGSDGDRRPIGDRLRQGEGAVETFAQFLSECEKAGPNDCVLAKLGDPKTVAESTLTYQVAVQVSFFSMYDPAGWPALAESLAELATASENTRAKSAGRAPELLVEWNRRKEEYASIGTALQPCVEARQSGRPLAYPQYADAADRRAPHFGRMRLWLGQPCEFLGVRDHDAFLGPWKLATKTPVMVIGTRYDPATPYQATRPYADLYRNAHLVTVEGYGHTVLGKSTCADNLITTYLTTLTAPADGTTCTQDRKPFDPAPTKTTLLQGPGL